jgi:hypothetical protein
MSRDRTLGKDMVEGKGHEIEETVGWNEKWRD